MALTFEERLALKRAIDEAKRARMQPMSKLGSIESALNKAIEAHIRRPYQPPPPIRLRPRRRPAPRPNVRSYHAWPKERIIAAFRAYYDEHGRAPRANEWECATEQYPTRWSVARRFGSWRAGVEAAGLTPLNAGRRSGQGNPAHTVRDGELRCSRCWQWKPDHLFGPASSRPSRRGRAYNCLPCDAERQRQYRQRQSITA